MGSVGVNILKSDLCPEWNEKSHSRNENPIPKMTIQDFIPLRFAGMGMGIHSG